MAENLAEGKEFRSFAALQDAVHKYEQSCFAQLSRTDSRTIENEEQRRNSRHFNPAIKYSFVTFTCAFGGKPYVSRSTGIRNSKPRIKCNCPVVLKCFASSDGQRLEVRHSQLDCHNHETSEETFKSLPRGRLLDEETELEIFNLIEMHENKKLARKLIKEKLIEETGRDISYKDIQNIEKRMSRRKEKERNGEEYDENEDFDDDDDEMERNNDEASEDIQTNDKGDTDHRKTGKDDGDKKEENGEDKPEVEGDSVQVKSPDQLTTKSKPKLQAKKTPKTAISTPSRKPKLEPSRPSSNRPRRAIREPKRFRDSEINLSPPPPSKKRWASDSEEEEEGEDSADSQGSNQKEIASNPAKVKKTPVGKRGRKPQKRPVARELGEIEDGEDNEESEIESPPVKKERAQQASAAKKESTNKSETESEELATSRRLLALEEQSLKMQQEMLKLQQQSLMLLQSVAIKLEGGKSTIETMRGDDGGCKDEADKVNDKVEEAQTDTAQIESST